MRLLLSTTIVLALSQLIQARTPDYLVTFSTNVNRSNIWDTSTYSIYVMFPDGSNLTKLVSGIEPTSERVIWSPDGTKIAFTANIDGLSGGMHDIYTKDLTSGTVTNLTKLSFGPIFTPSGDYIQHWIYSPVWSPKGDKISFDVINNGRNREVYVVNANGTGAVNVSNHPAPDFGSSWAPDGTRIVFSSRRNNTTPNDSNVDLFTVNADGTKLTNLTLSATQKDFYQWSPTDDVIAFYSAHGTESNLFFINSDGTGLTQVESSGRVCCDPMWSPDGQNIAFVEDVNHDNHYQIIVMNADGSNQLQVTDSTTTPIKHPYIWSPDGERILFSGTSSGGDFLGDLFIVNRDGTALKNATNFLGQYQGSWSSTKFVGSELSVSEDAGRFDDTGYDRLPKVGERISRTLTLRNTGDLPLQIHSLTVDNPSFSIETDSIELLSTDSIQVRLTYKPIKANVDSGTVVISSNDREHPEFRIPVSGATLGSIGPMITLGDRLDFGATVLGKRYVEELLIENKGNRDLVITSVSTGGSFFRSEPDTLVVAPNGGGSISITSAPSEPGSYSDTLRVLSNDPVSPEKEVILSGRGVRPPEGQVVFDFHLAEGDQDIREIGNVEPGKQLTVQINITDVPEIHGWALLLTYDPQKLRYVDGSFRAGYFLPELFSIVDAKRDSIEITAATKNAGRSGSGTLGYISFEALPGFADSSKIVIRETKLRLPAGEEDKKQVWSVATFRSSSVSDYVIQGDFNGDDAVSFDDFFLFADAFGRAEVLYDLNDSGVVDFDDFFIFADNFGKQK